MTALDRVCAVLTASGIAHALIGAAALAARGVARSTFDIDLLVADARVLLSHAHARQDSLVEAVNGELELLSEGMKRAWQSAQQPAF